MGDHGHADGFVAIGSIALDAGDGRHAWGCVTVKGPAERIGDYPKVLREVVESCWNS